VAAPKSAEQKDDIGGEHTQRGTISVGRGRSAEPRIPILLLPLLLLLLLLEYYCYYCYYYYYYY